MKKQKPADNKGVVMQNSTKIMLVAVLFLVVIIAIVWDRQNEEIEPGYIEAATPIAEVLDELPPHEQVQSLTATGRLTSSAPDPLPAFTDDAPASHAAPELQADEPALAAMDEPQETPEAAPEPAPAETEYVVQPNDSFWKIAQKFYGDGSKWRKILEANKAKCPTADLLRPKMRLVIPDVPSGAGEAAAAEATVTRTHTICRGDTLSSIARRYYGTSDFTSILKANTDKIPDKNHLRVGAVLVIPEKGN